MPDTAVAPPPPPSGGGGVSGGGSGIGQLLRDPEHYEEISVIGNGELMEMKCEKVFVINVCFVDFYLPQHVLCDYRCLPLSESPIKVKSK